MKTITAHLLEFTLDHHFNKNRSKCAKALDIRRADFNKIFNRCMSGAGNSLTMLEALLRLYYTEEFSMDEALRTYVVDNNLAESNASFRECGNKSRSMREQLNDESRAADRRAQVLKCAEQLMLQLEYAFCMDECAAPGSCTEDCPCMKFCDFVEWMKAKLDAPTQVQR